MLTSLQLILAGYCASSLLLFAFPRLIHIKKSHAYQPFKEVVDGSKILRIAHRGGSHRVVQNTITAFESCSSISDMFQMDTCLTKDGILVVHHDPSLLRTCGVDRLVSDCNFQELPLIQSQVEVHFTQNPVKIKSNGEKIPSLEEVFNRFKDKSINIEIKTPSIAAILQLKRLIYKYDRLDKTIVGISGSSNKELNIHFPECNKFMNFLEAPFIMLFFVIGLLPFLRISENVYQIPLYTKAFQQTKKRQTGDTWKNYIFFTVMKLSNMICKPLIWHLRRRGIMTYYWVCNNEKEYERAIKLGCGGIITDDAERLNDFLQIKKD